MCLTPFKTIINNAAAQRTLKRGYCDKRSLSRGWIPCLPIISHDMCSSHGTHVTLYTYDRSHVITFPLSISLSIKDTLKASPKEGIAKTAISEGQLPKGIVRGPCRSVKRSNFTKTEKDYYWNKGDCQWTTISPLEGILNPWSQHNSCVHRPCAQTNDQIDTNL